MFKTTHSKQCKIIKKELTFRNKIDYGYPICEYINPEVISHYWDENWNQLLSSINFNTNFICESSLFIKSSNNKGIL